MPIIASIIGLAYLSLWCMIFAYIWSVGTMKHDKAYPYMTLEITDTEKKYMWFHLFGLLWNVAVIDSTCDFIITAVVCIWYHQGQDDGGSPVSTAVGWAFFNHMGTIAFGGLILAIVWVFRIIAEYLAVR